MEASERSKSSSEARGDIRLPLLLCLSLALRSCDLLSAPKVAVWLFEWVSSACVCAVGGVAAVVAPRCGAVQCGAMPTNSAAFALQLHDSNTQHRAHHRRARTTE